MKKINICALAALALFTAACDKNGESTKMVQTMNYNAYSLVIPSTGNPTYCKSTYSFAFDVMNESAVVKCEDLSVTGTNRSFSTTDVPFYTGWVNVDNNQYQKILVVASNAGEDVTNLRAEITPGSWTNDKTLINSLTNQISSDPITIPQNTNPCNYLYMQYNLGTNVVRTFWPDLLFKGTTVTEYPGMPGPYSTTGFTYRVKMKLDDAANPKADVYFYNAKFAETEKAPTVNFVLQDLPLEFSSKGYSIAANDVVPVLVPENTPFPRFTFNNFRLQSNPEMGQISCSFTVADIYTGTFSGKGYILVETNL